MQDEVGFSCRQASSAIAPNASTWTIPTAS